MAIVKTTLSLTDHGRQWMDGIIASGEYVSNSEYIRALIRRDKERRIESTAEIELIRAKLIKAEQSGFTNKNRDEILARIRVGSIFEASVPLAPNYLPFLSLFAFAPRTILPTVVKCML